MRHLLCTVTLAFVLAIPSFPQSSSTARRIVNGNGIASTCPGGGWVYVKLDAPNPGLYDCPTIGGAPRLVAAAGTVGTAQGVWSGATTYGANALVGYSGVTYVSLAASNTNHQPDTSPTWWATPAPAGAAGATGAPGDSTFGGGSSVKVFNAKSDCNATGDGTTDDRANIATCIASAYAASPATVFFPPGKYYLNSYTDSTNILHITYTGTPYTVNLVGVDATFTTSKVGTVVLFEGAWVNSKISGIKFFNSHGVTTSTTQAIVTGGGGGNPAGNLTFTNNIFENFSRGIIFSGVTGATVSSNAFLMDAGRDSGTSTNAEPNVGVWMFNNGVNGNSQQIAIINNEYNGCVAASVASNTAKSCGDGLVYGEGTGATVANNNIRRFSFEGIFIFPDQTSGAPSTISHNVVDGSIVTGDTNGGGHYAIRADANNTAITNNSVVNTQYGIWTYGPDYVSDVTGISVNNNTITHTSTQALYSAIGQTGSSNFTISGNTVRYIGSPTISTQLYGIYISGRSSGVTSTGAAVRNNSLQNGVTGTTYGLYEQWTATGNVSTNSIAGFTRPFYLQNMGSPSTATLKAYITANSLSAGACVKLDSADPFCTTDVLDVSVVLDTDGTLAANSDVKLATQKAVKTKVDSLTVFYGSGTFDQMTASTAANGSIWFLTNANTAGLCNTPTTGAGSPSICWKDSNGVWQPIFASGGGAGSGGGSGTIYGGFTGGGATTTVSDSDCSSATDDTAAVQAKINALSAGDTLNFTNTSNACDISATGLSVSGKTNIRLTHSSTTYPSLGVFRARGTTYTTNERELFDISGCNNCLIDKLKINGDSQVVCGIFINNSTNFSIQNNEIYSCTEGSGTGPYAAIKTDQSTTNFWIANNNLHDLHGVNGAEGIRGVWAGVGSSRYSTTAHIINNTVANTGHTGIIVEGDGPIVTGNLITNAITQGTCMKFIPRGASIDAVWDNNTCNRAYGAGMQVETDTVHASNIYIRNNQFTLMSDWTVNGSQNFGALYLSGGSGGGRHARFTGNTITQGRKVAAYNNTDDVLIQNNTIVNGLGSFYTQIACEGSTSNVTIINSGVLDKQAGTCTTHTLDGVICNATAGTCQ